MQTYSNSNYKPNFGALKLNRNVPSKLKKQILRNPEFKKLSNYYEKENKDILVEEKIGYMRDELWFSTVDKNGMVGDLVLLLADSEKNKFVDLSNYKVEEFALYKNINNISNENGIRVGDSNFKRMF